MIRWFIMEMPSRIVDFYLEEDDRIEELAKEKEDELLGNFPLEK